jgi:hypothetical protein
VSLPASVAHAAAGATAALLLLAVRPGSASPPACWRDDAAMVVASDVVVTAGTLGVSAARSGTLRSMEARYRVIEGLKGRLKRGDLIRVRVSCLDEPVPPELRGYPAAQRYCRGDAGLALTGVDVRGARPLPPADARGWVLFLARELGAGPWREVSRVDFGGGCTVDPAALSPGDRRAIQLLRSPGSRPRP